MINYKRVRNEYIKDKFVTEDYYFLSYIIKHMATEAVERVVKETGIKVKVREDIRCSPHTYRHYFTQAQLSDGNEQFWLS